MKFMDCRKILLGLAGLILASGLLGGLIGYRAARRQLEARNNPRNWNARVSRQFDSLVKPTPEQAVRIQARLDEAVKELRQIRSQTVTRSTNVILRLVEAVEKELTPEQQKAFAVMKPKTSDLTLDVLEVGPDKK